MANNPSLLSFPIAQNGTKNTIPATQATPGDGLMSQSTGFPAECSLPLGAGGVAPDRADFNGAFNMLSALLFYVQKGWQFKFDSSQDYFEGCVVRDATDGKLYIAKNDVSASATEPHSDSTNWEGYDLSAYLPLSGGTMTGDIVNTWIKRSNASSESIVYGGTGPTDGALIGLRGATNTTYGAREAGSFALIAKNGANTKTLTGYPDGDLYWDGSITNCYLRRDNNTTETWLYGAQDNTQGASIGLRGNQCTLFGADQAGSFFLVAGNANTGPGLLGKTNGALTWKGTPVIYADGYTTWTGGESQWYEAIKWSDGRVEIYGHAVQAANVLGIQLNYPWPLIGSVTAQVTVDSAVGAGYVAATSFTYYSSAVGYFTIKNLDGTVPTEVVSCSYKVEGRWK